MIRRFSTLLTVFTALLVLAACGSSPDPWKQPAGQQTASEAPRALDAQDVWAGNAQPASDPSVQTDMGALQTPPVQEQSPAPMAAPVSSSTVKVALLVPLSGPGREVGEAIMNAAQLAIFDLNYENLELMPRDTHGTAQGASAAAESAARDGAQIILGPLFADEVRAVKPVAARYNLNVVGFSTDWTQAGSNTVLMGFMPFGQVRDVVDYAAKSGIRRVGVIVPDTEYGRAVMNTYQPQATANGIQTVDILRFRPGEDLTAKLRTFTRYDQRSATPGTPAPFDAVFVPAGGTDAQSIANLLSFYDMGPQNVRRIGTGLWDDPGLAADRNLAGGWFAAPDPASRRNFESKYRNTYGRTPPRVATLGYDSAALAIVLARNGYKTQGTPAYDINSIMNPNGFAGLDGIFRFRPDGLVERGLAVLEFGKGGTSVKQSAPRTFQSPPAMR